MQNLGYLLAVFIVVWALVFGYVFWVIARQRKLRQEIESLTERGEKRTSPDLEDR